MLHSTAGQPAPTTPLSPEHLAALLPCLPALAGLAQALLDFRHRPVCPVATQQLERDLLAHCREVGRAALEATLNALEPDLPDALPDDLKCDGTRHRRRFKSFLRVDSCFGTLGLRRWLYEPREPGERCLFPLDLLLGLVAGKATPALADRVGQLVAQHPQREVLRLLRQENGLRWSHGLLRSVSAAVAKAVAENREDAQADRLLSWLKQAVRGRGRHRPVLAVGRDGVMVPVCGSKEYQEASVATVAVYDRRGRRLGTVYLARMPEPLQQTLSDQLTDLLRRVLQVWRGQLPRLVYLSDGGQTPEGYYDGVLRRMRDPGRDGGRLAWLRVLDYYHAAGYVSKLAEALFGEAGEWWARKMRRVLKEWDGAKRVLQSASHYRNRQRLRGERQEEFRKAYNYLHKRRRHMDYARYKGNGMPIGSGVTEAGCKVVVTQRLKLSGMRWLKQGGQAVLDLRVVWLSGVWDAAWDEHVAEGVNPAIDSYAALLVPTSRAAA